MRRPVGPPSTKTLAVAGSVISLLVTLLLPETVGRSFAVVEGKERTA